MVKLFLMGLLSNLGMLSILHSRKGEAGEGEGASGGEGASDNKFTQDDVNNIVSRETKKVAEKYGDYEDLRKFKSQYEQEAQEREQQELEKNKEYEKLKDGWLSKEREYQNKLAEKDTALNNERINNALTNEVMRQGGYPEAAKLVRELTNLTQDGKVVIHGKNEQGIDTDLTVEQGVKQFLKDRPYLVKDNSGGGAGTPAAQGQGGEQGQGSNSGDLADQLHNARLRGDRKEINRIKEQIRGRHNTGAILTR